ncbi:MAG: 23S rRNA (adenine(2503)-C(2))-methyltransferase RlmN, partial [Myxococcales bacterium]|nr:23S rRNA (adenine(2503)-C(2))-methyltransferase RlmN [Myxococcales bacterium]
ITIEYTLIRGVNDSVAEAKDLVKLLARIPAKVNLIPMNPITGSPLGAPEWESVERFQATVHGLGLACTVRTQRGDDISAACGQLALHGEKRKVKMRLPTTRDEN